MNKELNFKKYLKEDKESKKDIYNTISKLPKNHQKALNGLNIEYTCKNTLDFDKKHIGQLKGKEIIVSAPWNYSRQFTTLHEIAHVIWCKVLNEEQKKQWEKISKNKKVKEKNKEELFCMAYANYYSKHKILIYQNKKWEDFIKKLN
jgi:hypothetical protein